MKRSRGTSARATVAYLWQFAQQQYQWHVCGAARSRAPVISCIAMTLLCSSACDEMYCRAALAAVYNTTAVFLQCSRSDAAKGM
jgi:hypothetical protein